MINQQHELARAHTFFAEHLTPSLSLRVRKHK